MRRVKQCPVSPRILPSPIGRMSTKLIFEDLLQRLPALPQEAAPMSDITTATVSESRSGESAE